MGSVLVQLALLTVLTPIAGRWLYRVFTRAGTGRIEGGIYRLAGIDVTREQTWRGYAGAVLWFSVVSFLLLYLLQRTQGSLPLNPLAHPGVPPLVAFNTATSFVSNTDWQAYGGETTMSYLTQMLGMTVQNFVTPAVGLAVLVALVRGFARERTDRVGNFWVDLTRGVVYVLLPLSAVFALFLITQGTVQNLASSVSARGVQGFDQVLAQGPVASQVAIKMLGTNGGGFFNANSAHPFENPTWLSNTLQTLAILLLPAGCTSLFGRMVRNRRQGWVVYGAMVVLLVAGLAITLPVEREASPAMRAAGVSASADNLEGKELRLGTDPSAVFAVFTTAASNGAVNSMHDSYTPLGGVAPLFNMAVGEVVFGGVGSGLYGMLFYVVIAVFLGGLMVGRTPEYLGKKIGPRQIKLAVLGVIVPFAVLLLLLGAAVVLPAGLDARLNAGPHGFSEITYALASMANNNGSAFAGLTATNGFYTVGGGIAMLIGRFVPMVLALALAGSLGKERILPATEGTLRTDTPLFGGLVTGTVALIGGLTFVPLLVLGPVAEWLAGTAGELF